MTTRIVESGLIEHVGSPEKIIEELLQFRKDVILLAQLRPNLTKKYPDKWVAFHNGKVIRIEDTLGGLLKELDKQRLPRNKVVTQFLSTAKRVMIL